MALRPREYRRLAGISPRIPQAVQILAEEIELFEAVAGNGRQPLELARFVKSGMLVGSLAEFGTNGFGGHALEGRDQLLEYLELTGASEVVQRAGVKDEQIPGHHV